MRRRYTSDELKAVLALLDRMSKAEIASVRGSCNNRLRATRAGGRPRKAKPAVAEADERQPWE